MSEDRGVRCPRCNCGMSEVVRTARAFGKIRRRRRCRNCGALYQSAELVERLIDADKPAHMRELEGTLDAEGPPDEEHRR